MSLAVYTSKDKIPSNIQLICNNDVFFVGYTDIPDDNLTKQLLQNIDGVKRVSDTLFESKFVEGMSLSKDMLSTGTKTLLNITQHPDKCFSTIECGENALTCLKSITTGHALVEVCCISYVDDPVCDITVNGRPFTDFNEAVECIYHGGVYDED